ncbi:MAG TPA: S-methyl-5-thioribose-1-phosphate isomerase [Nitrososphaerales archaeon]|nr:S-methyl-5-thioribose-1-phosphate isomerase [Nitrososphaerales archaeon]
MKENFFTLRTVIWDEGRVKMIDQTRLPGRLVYRSYDGWQGVAEAIRTLVVRGAPAIGVAAAMAVAVTATRSKASDLDSLRRELEKAAAGLRATRPTAVNLFWGIDRAMGAASKARTPREAKDALVKEVVQMAEEDVAACKTLGRFGADLIESGDTVMTHCNAGALATVGYGTALGVIRAASEQGKCVKVVVPETRPALQGSRLTAFELVTDGFDCKLISDTAVGSMMQSGRIDKVVVGADRVTKDGYVFNKIGTYQVAVLANRHGVPFYPAAPSSSFDLSRTHDQVRIEERFADEVVKIRGRRIAPKGVPVANPAFDATPPDLVTKIVSDKGVIGQPLAETITSVMR